MRRVIVGVLLGVLAGVAQADNEKSVADLTKGMTASEGFVTVYRKKDKTLLFLIERNGNSRFVALQLEKSKG